MSQFVFTCLMLSFVFSATKVNAVLSWDSQSFRIERKVNLDASVSCGEGILQREQTSLCGLSENEENQGLLNQDCSACDPRSKMYLRIDSALAADNRTEWRSLEKTKDSTLQEINITINFPQVFKVERISVKAGSTPLPALWALEESRDFKSEFKVIRYFAADQEECLNFGVSKCVLKSNDSWEESEKVDVLASIVRLRFFRVRSDFDFYSVSEISIEGQCDCNGHADKCSVTDGGLMACHCINNSCGVTCELCCPGYALNDIGDCAEIEESANNTVQPLLSNLSILESIEHITDLGLPKIATKLHTVVHKPGKPASVSTTNKHSTLVTSTANIKTPSLGPVTNKAYKKNTKAVELTLVESTEQPGQTTDGLDVGDFLKSEVNRSDSSSDDSLLISAPQVTNEEDTSHPSSEISTFHGTTTSNTSENATAEDTIVKSTAVSSTPEASTSAPATENSDASSATVASVLEDTTTERNTLATANFKKDEDTTEEIINTTQSSSKSSTKDYAFKPTTLPSTIEAMPGSSINLPGATEKMTTQPATDQAANSRTTVSYTVRGQKITKTASEEEDTVEKPKEMSGATEITTATIKAATTTKAATDKPVTEKSTVRIRTTMDWITHEIFNKQTTVTDATTDENLTERASLSLSLSSAPSSSSFPSSLSTSSSPSTQPSSFSSSSTKAETKVTTDDTTTAKRTDEYSVTPTTGTTTTTVDKENSLKESTTEKSVVIEKNATNENHTYPFFVEETQKPSTTAPQSATTQSTSLLIVHQEKKTATEWTDLTSPEIATHERSDNGLSSEQTTTVTIYKETTRTKETSAIKTTDESSTEKITTVDQTTAKITTADRKTKEAQTVEATSPSSITRKTASVPSSKHFLVVKQTSTTGTPEETTNDKTTVEYTSWETATVSTVSSTELTPTKKNDPSTTPKSETTISTKATLKESLASGTRSDVPTVSSTVKSTSRFPLGKTTDATTSSVKTTTQFNLLEGTLFPPVVEEITTSISTEDETTTVPTTVETTTETTIVNTTNKHSTLKGTREPSTLPTTLDVTTKPTKSPTWTTTLETAKRPLSLNITAEPVKTTEPFPPVVERTTVPTKGKTTFVPTTLETTFVPDGITTDPLPPLVDISTLPTTLPATLETTKRPLPANVTTESVKTTTEPFPSLVESITEPTTQKTISVSTTAAPEETTTDLLPPLIDISTLPTAIKITSKPTTVQTTTSSVKTKTEAFPPLVEIVTELTTMDSATVPATLESSTVPVKTTTEPFPPLIDISTLPTTVKIVTDPTASPVKTTTEPFPPLVEIATKLNSVESTAVIANVETTTVLVKTTTETFPPLVELTTGTGDLKSTFKTTTVKSTATPTSVEATTEPFPALVETTSLPTIVETRTEPTTTIPTIEAATVITTPAPTTPDELTEDQARILFDLPKGVCYCVKFATVDRRCFPKALHKPCICRSNFAGVRCGKCARGHFNYPFCAPCRCNKLGSANLTCNVETGRCTCKPGIRGRKCDACPLGSFNFPTCPACDCNPSGSYDGMCDPFNGQCPCRYGNRGRQCNKCLAGYYNFPYCQWCGCNPLTTTENICEDFNGGYRCLCKSNFQGRFCGECKRGYYDFPLCKKCSCSPRGYGLCNELGDCVCDAGYAGNQCDRCASGYYGFPNCRPCNCNTFGSYSKQCNHTTGQCACRQNISGNHCDRCVKGMVGFPKCVECECNPDGTRFLPGKTDSMCFGTTEYKCLCKANVVGKTCDRCRHGYYNFNGSNPSGCSPCTCSSHGTISGIRHCHAQYGHCHCKNYVTGAKCDSCRDGYYALKSHNLFGCKACKCDPGGSTSMNCFKHSGDCSCVTGVRGKKCNSIYSSSPLYFPTLYQISVELEGAVLTTNSRVRVPVGANANVFPSFSGIGYAIFPAYKPYYVTVNIPKTRSYRIIFHYALRENLHASARVVVAARGSKISTHTFEVQFSPPKPGAQQTKNLKATVNRRGRIREFDMKKGVWNIVVTSHSSMLLLDYIVFLPEDYYKAELLNNISSEPCLLRTSKPEHCDMYTYYEPKSTSIISVSGDKAYTLPLRGKIDMFIDPRFDLSDQRLSNMALLGNIQPTIGFDISVPESGPYVIMVTYLHPERFTHRVFVRAGYQRGQLEILPCKYQFACRQFAVGDNKKAKSFELTGTPDKHEIKLESSVSSKIAVISITIIPLAKWNTQYIQPAFRCRMYNRSCISTSFQIPPDAIQLAAFSRRFQVKMTSVFTGAVRPKTVYYIIVYYQQTHSLSKKVEQILIANQVKANISVTFRYCPARLGCRIVLGEEDSRRFQFSKGIFTATIEHDRRTHVGHILLIPERSYTPRLLKPQSTDRLQQFIQNCGKDHFHVDPLQAGRMCREDVFTLTVGFNRLPLQCKCNLLGSRSVFCEQFGGQCLCHANVIGRKCDRCRLGHSGFPRCRTCGCHEIGSVSPTCTSGGQCRCKPGFGGYKCNRCRSSGYYGFPDCKPCACNSLGSLSMFCRSRDGQCQCRTHFQGKKCSECRIGFYDFPRCKACGCNPAGIKLLPGQTNGCGSVNNTHCVCKNNVAGDDCDSCKPLTFNLQMSNPLGCQSCDCNTNGTLGTIATCHAATGQCQCKSYVTDRRCERCKEGYYHFKGSDVFGCKRCSCNAGLAVSQSCNAVTGDCTCLRGIGGTQCDRVASNAYYYPTLYQHKIELEDGFIESGRAAYFRYSESEFTGFSWRGYVVFTQSQNFIYIMIDVPRTSKYQLIFHYNYISYLPVTAIVKFIPTLDSASLPDGPAREQTLDVQFRSTSSWIIAVPEILLVRDYRWEPRRVMLSQGKWKLTMTAAASDLFVDYLALLPEEYYSPRNLVLKVTNPCTLRRDERYCVHFTYPTLKKEGIVTIQAEDSSVVGGIRRSQRVGGNVPFRGRLLSGLRNVMSVRLPSTVKGQFVLVASYFYNSNNEGRLSVVVRTGEETFNAGMGILSCRYRFGCRQVAIDANHDVHVFTANPDEITTVSITSQFMVALDFISAIPLSMWNQKLLIPAEQCIDNGFSCIQTSYRDPSDASKIEVEDRSTGGDTAPYYIMDRMARLKHIKVGQKTVFVRGTARSGRYYVIVHFYQPSFLSFLGKVVISGQNAATTLLTFRHCPHVSGCRAIGTSQYREGISESIYIGRQNNIIVSITIPEDKGVWIDYVMLVPLSSFSPSLMEINPIDENRDFIQDCGQKDFYLKESSSNFCLSSTFKITAQFNNGALPCECDRLGSTKTDCRAFGGQCTCRPNVIGRACDRCKSGYSGFPHCRKLTT